MLVKFFLISYPIESILFDEQFFSKLAAFYIQILSIEQIINRRPIQNVRQKTLAFNRKIAVNYLQEKLNQFAYNKFCM